VRLIDINCERSPVKISSGNMWYVEIVFKKSIMRINMVLKIKKVKLIICQLNSIFTYLISLLIII